MIHNNTKIILLSACVLLFLYGCTSLGHFGGKDVDKSAWVKIIISKGVVVEKVDGSIVMDAAGSNMVRTMTVNPGMRTFLVRYWRVVPNKGSRVSSGMTELKKEVQAGKAYRILANESSETVAFDIAEEKE